MSPVKGNGDMQMKVGEFLVKNSIITEEQLNDALEMQKDNPERLIGEILVTLGILTKEDIIMALEMFLMVTDGEIDFADEWLDQDEVDLIIERIKNKNNR